MKDSDATTDRADRRPGPVYARAIQTSVRNNASAFGFSVMVTASLAVISSIVGLPQVGDVFLFLFGAVAGTIVVEAAATRGFRRRMRGEPPEVVALGSAFSLLSVTVGVGLAALMAAILDNGVAWPLSAFAATVGYLPMVAIEMALAERAAPTDREEGQP